MTDTPSINGWTPPVVYDLANDTHRVATQDDFDRRERDLILLGGFFRDTLKAAQAVLEQLRRTAPADDAG